MASEPDEALPEAPPLIVLSVEDNSANTALLAQFFARWQVDLIAAPSGRAGLQAAFDNGPTLVLLDLNLPDLSGEEVFAQLKADPRTAGTPVIILSADASPNTVQRLLDAGVSAYLTKPIDLLKLSDIIERTASRHGLRRG